MITGQSITFPPFAGVLHPEPTDGGQVTMRVVITPPYCGGVRWDALTTGDWFRVHGESVARLKVNSDDMVSYRDYGPERSQKLEPFDRFYNRTDTKLVRLIPLQFEFQDQDNTK